MSETFIVRIGSGSPQINWPALPFARKTNRISRTALKPESRT